MVVISIVFCSLLDVHQGLRDSWWSLRWGRSLMLPLGQRGVAWKTLEYSSVLTHTPHALTQSKQQRLVIPSVLYLI